MKQIFLNYPWRGNIRELKNIIKRAVILADNKITLECIPPTIINDAAGSTCKKNNINVTPVICNQNSLKKTIENDEKKIIEELLRKNHGNKKKAAIELKIARKTLYNKLKKYNIM